MAKTKSMIDRRRFLEASAGAAAALAALKSSSAADSASSIPTGEVPPAPLVPLSLPHYRGPSARVT